MRTIGCWLVASAALGIGASWMRGQLPSVRGGTATDAFTTQVAPLLTRHCVACHGPTTRKGRLDLSRQDTALAGGRSGKAIVPGKPDASLLWKHVAAGEMPPPKENASRSSLSPTSQRHLVRQPAQLALRTVLGLQAKLHDIELELTHGGQDRLAAERRRIGQGVARACCDKARKLRAALRCRTSSMLVLARKPH